MATWMEGAKVSAGRELVDRKDADGLKSWLDGLAADKEKLLKALNGKDDDGRTILHWAVSSGDQRVVKMLLDYGSEIEGADDEGTTALHSACACGDQATTRQLLETLQSRVGDDRVRNYVRAGTGSKVTALHYAAGRGSTPLIEMLTDFGSKINPRDKAGNPPLFRAIGKGKDEAAILLMEKGADLEIQNAAGDTALHIACENGSDRLVRYIVDKGGLDLFETKNEDEKTAFDVCDTNYKQQLLMFLEGAG